VVFDVDSDERGSFDETDQKWLQKILKQVFTETKP
jgi:putative methionine-R-sulfoxide reductase with GAF domain